MQTLTVSISEEIKEKLDKHPNINWSAYLKERFILKIVQLKKFESLASKEVT